MPTPITRNALRRSVRSAMDSTARRNPELSAARRGPQRIKRISAPKIKRGPIMGGGLPAPGNMLASLGRAWMDRGRTVTPGRGVVGADRSMLQGTLNWASNEIRRIGQDTGVIRPRVPKRGSRLTKP